MEPKLVLPETYGEQSSDIDYEQNAKEMWDDSVQHVEECKAVWHAERVAAALDQTVGEVKWSARAREYDNMRNAWATGSYTAAGLLMFADVYEDETQDAVGADLIRQFAAEFNKREATII